MTQYTLHVNVSYGHNSHPMHTLIPSTLCIKTSTQSDMNYPLIFSVIYRICTHKYHLRHSYSLIIQFGVSFVGLDEKPRVVGPDIIITSCRFNGFPPNTIVMVLNHPSLLWFSHLKSPLNKTSVFLWCRHFETRNKHRPLLQMGHLVITTPLMFLYYCPMIDFLIDFWRYMTLKIKIKK